MSQKRGWDMTDVEIADMVLKVGGGNPLPNSIRTESLFPIPHQIRDSTFQSIVVFSSAAYC